MLKIATKEVLHEITVKGVAFTYRHMPMDKAASLRRKHTTRTRSGEDRLDLENMLIERFDWCVQGWDEKEVADQDGNALECNTANKRQFVLYNIDLANDVLTEGEEAHREAREAEEKN